MLHFNLRVLYQCTIIKVVFVGYLQFSMYFYVRMSDEDSS